MPRKHSGAISTSQPKGAECPRGSARRGARVLGLPWTTRWVRRGQLGLLGGPVEASRAYLGRLSARNPKPY
eukprot:4425942-Pyramimonas_sp.AAC.1